MVVVVVDDVVLVVLVVVVVVVELVVPPAVPAIIDALALVAVVKGTVEVTAFGVNIAVEAFSVLVWEQFGRLANDLSKEEI